MTSRKSALAMDTSYKIRIPCPVWMLQYRVGVQVNTISLRYHKELFSRFALCMVCLEYRAPQPHRYMYKPEVILS